MKCSILTAARLHCQQKSKWRVAFITFTYRPGVDWSPCQISVIVRHIRQWFKRRGFDMRHVWKLELTKKGRPHYHMAVWLPPGLSLPKPDKQGWWSHGFTKIEYLRHTVGYLAKYLSKDDAEGLSKGARMHGTGGLTDEALLEQRWWRLPSWVREDHAVTPSDRVRRAATGSGGGFVNPDSGEVYKSPWSVFFKGGYVFIERR